MIQILLNKLIETNRFIKRLLMSLFDSILIVFALLCSFSLRLDYWYWPNDEIFWIVFGAPLVAIPIFISFRLYKSMVRYTGIQSLTSIAQAITLYSVIWGLIGYMATIDGIPRSVIVLNWMITLLVIGGYRILVRWLLDDEKLFTTRKKIQVIIYGAGSAGRQLSHALKLSKEYKHIAYIDDNLGMGGIYMNGVSVLPYSSIQKLVESSNVSEIFLALPSISRKKRNEIAKKLSLMPIKVKSLPSVSKLTEGKVKIDDLLEIDISDLLGRDSVSPNQELLKTNITDKVVLITGAGGSIGSEICRQILFLKPKKLILFESSESALYHIEQELISKNISNIEISPIIGSVRDFKRMEDTFNYYEVQTIYHTAAYKHVPLVESNQSQGILNNSIGTMLAAEAAISAKIETFVLISTDKAVRPSSIMGVTKRVAELVLQGLATQNHNTCLTMVRFGNVLDSSGSVIPLFKNQIKKGGPITVTDINIVRYFMTIPEAVELVIQAGAIGKGGDVFVLDMGEPVKIYDLAVKMIQLSGLQLLDNDNPDGDIEIIYTGLRPGEKLYEELLIGNNSSKTVNKLIMRAEEEMIDWKILKPIMNELLQEAIDNNQVRIRELLMKIVPEYDQTL